MPRVSPYRVNLVMFNPNKFGGTVTYTAHLYHALRMAGCEVMIYLLAKRLSTVKDFGYGCRYRSGPVEEILSLMKSSDATLITACIGKEYEEPTLRLLAAGAFVTVHDPNDLGNFTDLSWVGLNRIVVIRPHNTRLCPNARFIPHPFVRSNEGPMHWSLGDRPRHALTLSRLGAIKRTRWVVEANRVLPPECQIWLRGYDDRFFTFNAFVRDGKYPEFKQDSELPESEKKTFAKELGEAQRLAGTARYLVDLTHIKGDGGGTQYTFLEAIDSGCVLVLNDAWTNVPGIWKPEVNCLSVADTDGLVACLTEPRPTKRLEELAANSYQILAKHEPHSVARQYLSFFQERG